MTRNQWACEIRGDYPEDWDSIRYECYGRANWTCEHCGMEFVAGTTKAKTARTRKGKPLILTVHHLNGDKANCTWPNLLVCCQRCHLKIQGTWAPGRMLPQWLNPPPQWLLARDLPFVWPSMNQEVLL